MNPRFTLPKLRWIIAGLLLMVTLINYVDRMAISVLVKNILENFQLTENDYGQIVALFMIAYAVMYAVSGYIVDRLLALGGWEQPWDAGNVQGLPPSVLTARSGEAAPDRNL